MKPALRQVKTKHGKGIIVGVELPGPRPEQLLVQIGGEKNQPELFPGNILHFCPREVEYL